MVTREVRQAVINQELCLNTRGAGGCDRQCTRWCNSLEFKESGQACFGVM